MIREIMRDETFLAQKAEPATLEDLACWTRWKPTRNAVWVWRPT